MLPERQYLDPTRTTWHITWGTYGTRLHGSYRPTVSRDRNQRGEPFVEPDPELEQALTKILNFTPRLLTSEQQLLIESELPTACERGGWDYRIAAAGPDHIHVLCDVDPEIHGEKVRRLLKRWLGQALAGPWPLQAKETWWAEEGSNKPVKDEIYLKNVHKYIERQRATPAE